MQLNYVGGTIKKTDAQSFKKMIFRATRGKAYTHFFDVNIDIEDRMRGVNDHIEKYVYIIIFEQGFYLR